MKNAPVRINVTVSNELLAQLTAAYNAAGRAKDRPPRELVAQVILQVSGALNRTPAIGIVSEVPRQRPADPE